MNGQSDNMNKSLQKYQIAKYLDNAGVSSDLIDLSKIIDESLHLAENIENVENEIGIPVMTGEEDPEQEKLDLIQLEADRKLLDSEEFKEAYMENQWLKIIELPGVALLRGRRRHGKTALGFFLLWLFHEKRELTPCVVNFPKEKRHLLPDFIRNIDDLDDIPNDSIVLFDEVSMKYYADKYKTSEKEVLDSLINISGQKNQIIIFISHHSAKILKAIVREIDMQLFKKPSEMHAKMERGEIRIFTKEALEAFEKIKDLSEHEIKSHTYVITEDFNGFITNPLPEFWNDEISVAWSDVKLEVKKESPYLTDKQLTRLINDRLVRHKRRKVPKT